MVRLAKAMVFPVVMYGCELDYEESWAPKNSCFWIVVLEKTLESPLDWKEIQRVHPKGDQSWVFNGKTDAKAETPILWPPHAKSSHWKRPWCWEGLGAGGEGDDRGWDSWMASPTQWTWVWVNSRSWWWTGRPGVLWFMGSQRVGHDWMSELIYIPIISLFFLIYFFQFLYLFIFLFVVDFVIHWNETAMGLHVFPIPIPPPTSLSTRCL